MEEIILLPTPLKIMTEHLYNDHASSIDHSQASFFTIFGATKANITAVAIITKQ